MDSTPAQVPQTPERVTFWNGSYFTVAPGGLRSNGTKRSDFIATLHRPDGSYEHFTGFVSVEAAFDYARSFLGIYPKRLRRAA